MKNVVTERFINCLETLYEEHRIVSYRQFALKLDCQPQNLSNIRKKKRDAPVELLRKAIEVFNFNPVYLFTGEGPKFSHLEAGRAFDVLTIVADPDDNEKIIHVPVQAQAGYVNGYMDPAYIQEMPTYSLPDMRYRSGSYRSFDVAGSSMLPTIKQFDRLICRYIESQFWKTSIKDNHVYVLVTTNDVVVKRVQNFLSKKHELLAISDNEYFQPYSIHLQDIREVWHVETVIRQFDHFPSHLKRQQKSDVQPQKEKEKVTATQVSDEFNPDDFSELMDGL